MLSDLFLVTSRKNIWKSFEMLSERLDKLVIDEIMKVDDVLEG